MDAAEMRKMDDDIINQGITTISPTETKFQAQEDAARNHALEMKAREIWNSKDTIHKLVRLLSEYHEGDAHILTLLLLMFIQGKIITLPETVYLTIYAEAGEGKSHAFTTTQAILPEGFVKDTGLSDKCLTRAKGNIIPDGAMIVFDDNQPSPNIYEMMKICSSRDRKPKYCVLEGQDNKPVEYELPNRLTFVQIRVDTPDGTVDAEQIKSRGLVVYTDSSKQHDKKVKDLIRKRAAIDFNPLKIGKLNELREYLWQDMPDHFLIDGKIAEHLAYKGEITNRQLQQCITLMECYTVFSQWDNDFANHKTDGANGVYLKSTKEDLINAIAMMNNLFVGKGGDLNFKVGKKGNEIHKKVLEKYEHERKIWDSGKDMFKDIGMLTGNKNAYNDAYRAFFGRKNGSGERGTRILGTIPGYSTEEITETTSPITTTTAKGDIIETYSKRESIRKHRIIWDPEVYHQSCQMVSGFYYTDNEFEHPDDLSQEELDKIANIQILERHNVCHFNENGNQMANGLAINLAN